MQLVYLCFVLTCTSPSLIRARRSSSSCPFICVLLPCDRNHIRRWFVLFCLTSSSSLPCCVSSARKHLSLFLNFILVQIKISQQAICWIATKFGTNIHGVPVFVLLHVPHLFRLSVTSFTPISHFSITSAAFERRSCSLSVRPDRLLPSSGSRTNMWLGNKTGAILT